MSCKERLSQLCDASKLKHALELVTTVSSYGRSDAEAPVRPSPVPNTAWSSLEDGAAWTKLIASARVTLKSRTKMPSPSCAILLEVQVQGWWREGGVQARHDDKRSPRD